MLIFHCRLCGGLERVKADRLLIYDSLVSRQKAIEALQEQFTGYMVKVHECRDGNLGVMDLRGME